MIVREVSRIASQLPATDDHPYRTGAWQPQLVEYDADDCDVLEGAIPKDLAGVYLRNTENPVLPAIGRYHPFDGDGMLHAIRFRAGHASYRNRFVRTEGLAAELAAGQPLWAGIVESPAKSQRDGWGARGRMKDASSTDVVVHNGKALTTFYQCGDAYQSDPVTLAQHGPAAFARPSAGIGHFGISAHPKVDPATGELLWFGYGANAPYMSFGVLDKHGNPTVNQPIPLPGPRLPHDMAFTEHYAILNDFPLFWEPELLAKGVHRPRWHPELPSRFAIVPRAGGEVRWFEASPTYVLHWINAFEDGDEIVLDGYHQADPLPKPDLADGPYAGIKRMLCIYSMGTTAYRWRFNLVTGQTREERLYTDISEFPSINHSKPGQRHRYVWSMTAPRGWFLFDGLVRYDLETGEQQRWKYPEGVYASESPMAPRPGAGRAEDDGWVVTFVSDVTRDRGECHVFDAARIGDGPVARIALPARMSSGTHACWAPDSALHA